jgi:DNA-directed RNA polymerase subunit RPC12/RpoP
MKQITYVCQKCIRPYGFDENVKPEDLFCSQCGRKLSYLITEELDEETHKVVKEYKEQDRAEAHPYIRSTSNKSTQQSTQSTLKCPRCGSTSVAITARGVSAFWGFIGANKTVNRCGNCGYTWKPNGR